MCLRWCLSFILNVCSQFFAHKLCLMCFMYCCINLLTVYLGLIKESVKKFIVGNSRDRLTNRIQFTVSACLTVGYYVYAPIKLLDSLKHSKNVHTILLNSFILLFNIYFAYSIFTQKYLCW